MKFKMLMLVDSTLHHRQAVDSKMLTNDFTVWPTWCDALRAGRKAESHK